MSNLQSLKNFMFSKGLPFDGDILLDGKIHRYSALGKTNDLPEWYVGDTRIDGEYWCTFSSWRPGFDNYHFFSKEKPTEEDLKYLEDTRKNLEELQEKESIEAAKNALKIWNRSDIAIQGNPYLQKKKIQSHGIKELDGNLIIPIYDIQGNLISIQKIFPDGTKRFLSGGRIKGGFLILGDIEKNEKVWVCEGFATGSSIYESTQLPVAIAFSCNNLLRVGSVLKIKYPSKKIGLCADLGKAGDESMVKWKEFISPFAKQPDFKGKGNDTDKDFNDLASHKEFGKSEVKRQLQPTVPIASIQDILTNNKEIEWTVPNLLIKGSVNLIYGNAGAGKSAFSQSLGFACSQGFPFLMFKPNKCKVLYIDGELSIPENKERIKSILSRYPSNQDIEISNFHFVTVDDVLNTFGKTINLYNQEWQDTLDNIFPDYDLIFLDNISTLTGECEADYENSSASWSVIGSWLRKWKMGGKTIVVVHHANKSGGARGTSMISVEMMLQLKLDALAYDGVHDIQAKVIYEKARQISAKYKNPFEIKLKDNKWIWI